MTQPCEMPVTRLHVKPKMTVNELVKAMGKAGAYNGGSLARAADIWEQMLRDEETTKFFGLAGAMVPAGMGGIVSDLIKGGHIDILVSTGANLTHDIIEAIGCRHFHGTAFCDDIELRHDEINRIYDVYLPNEAFEHFEEFMQGVFGELEPGSTISISGLLEHIGKHAKSGILHTAARKKIPVYNPAVQDSMIGLQVLALLADEQGDRRCVCRHAGADGPVLHGKESRGHARGWRGAEELHPPEHAHDPERFQLRHPTDRRPPGPRRALGRNAGRGPVVGQDHGRGAGSYRIRRRHDHPARADRGSHGEAPPWLS